jgi:hypothetical protein
VLLTVARTELLGKTPEPPNPGEKNRETTTTKSLFLVHRADLRRLLCAGPLVAPACATGRRSSVSTAPHASASMHQGPREAADSVVPGRGPSGRSQRCVGPTRKIGHGVMPGPLVRHDTRHGLARRIHRPA